MFSSTKSNGRSSTLMAVLTMSCLAFFSRCAGDQAKSQGQDPVEQGGTASDSNASLNGAPAKGTNEASAEGAAMNNAVEGGTEGNFAGSNTGDGFNNAGGNQPANDLSTNENAALGPTLNNATGGDGLGAANAPLNAGGTLNPTAATTNPINAGATPLNNTALNGGTNQAGAVPQETPSTAPSEPKQQVATTSSPGSAAASASPFTNPQMNWPAKGKVKYVTRNVTRHAAPNGPIVGEFEQGDHPLIYQNGNWVELHDGSFVKGNGLSDKGVGYSKGRKTWH